MMVNNHFTLNDKKVLVTGASSNIGKKIAVRCSEMGASLFISGRNEKRLQETFENLQDGKNVSFRCELSDADSIASMVEQLPVLNGIVLCAAQFDSTPVKNIRRDLVLSMFETNTFSNFDLVQRLLKTKKIERGGSIVFISSVASMRPYKGNSLYSATKGAINSFSKVLATELGGKGIRVNCIHPGIVRRETGMREGSLSIEQQRQEMEKFPLGMGETDDIAYATVFLLADESRWITGIDLIVDGGQSLI